MANHWESSFSTALISKPIRSSKSDEAVSGLEIWIVTIRGLPRRYTSLFGWILRVGARWRNSDSAVVVFGGFRLLVVVVVELEEVPPPLPPKKGKRGGSIVMRRRVWCGKKSTELNTVWFASLSLSLSLSLFGLVFFVRWDLICLFGSFYWFVIFWGQSLVRECNGNAHLFLFFLFFLFSL